MTREAVRRFEREAQVIARLRSPHTVELFDFGVAADGAFYYVMELLDGLDADTLVRRFGPTPPERAIHLLRQVCHSLSEAQSCGLVHRDIKPANIFLCRYGEEYDFVKVLDFGIVASQSTTPMTRTPVQTRENDLQGTPAFMAPEQAMGRPAGRAGRHLCHRLRRLLASDRAATCSPPTRRWGSCCSTRRRRRRLHRPGPSCPIPPALDDLVLSCLAKDPAQRPQSARELSRRLAEVEAPSAWTQERAREWWTLHKPTQG